MIKQRLIFIVHYFLFFSGLATLYQFLRKEYYPVILMYHSVSSISEREWIDSDNDVPEELFKKQIEYLKNNCQVISLDQFRHHLINKIPFKPRTVLITFDDGYKNNLDIAVEVLKKYDMPAVLYLATKYVDDSQPQWIDELHTYFKSRRQSFLDLPSIGEFNLDSRKTRKLAYSTLKKILISATFQDRRNILNNIRQQLHAQEIPVNLTLNWSQLRNSLKKNPLLEIGVHSHHHVDFTSIDPVSQKNEMIESINRVQSELGITPTHLSYPYGRWDNNIKTEAKKFRMITAAATQPISLIKLDSDIYALPRVTAPSSFQFFKYLVSGAYPDLPVKVMGRI